MAEQEERVPCVVCREPIRKGAKVCVHCNRAQNWTRHLIRWSTLAGASVAVISLLSAAVSLREFIPTPAKLKVIPMACGRESVELAVSNLGDEPGMLRQVSLRFRVDSTRGDKTILLTAVKGKKLIGPHETNELEYKRFVAGTEASISESFMGMKDCTYVISAMTVDFEGSEMQQEVECPCP